MLPQLLLKTLPWYRDIAGNRTDVFEVRACPAGGAGTTIPFLDDEDVQQSERYVGSYLARGSITYEVKNSATTHTWYIIIQEFVLPVLKRTGLPWLVVIL